MTPTPHDKAWQPYKNPIPGCKSIAGFYITPWDDAGGNGGGEKPLTTKEV